MHTLYKMLQQIAVHIMVTGEFAQKNKIEKKTNLTIVT